MPHAQPDEFGGYQREAEKKAWAQAVAAMEFISEGRHSDALAITDKALASSPRCKEAWVARGGALALLHDPEAALVCFDRALSLDPDYELATQQRGLLVRMYPGLPRPLNAAGSSSIQTWTQEPDNDERLLEMYECAHCGRKLRIQQIGSEGKCGSHEVALYCEPCDELMCGRCAENDRAAHNPAGCPTCRTAVRLLDQCHHPSWYPGPRPRKTPFQVMVEVAQREQMWIPILCSNCGASMLITAYTLGIYDECDECRNAFVHEDLDVHRLLHPRPKDAEIMLPDFHGNPEHYRAVFKCVARLVSVRKTLIGNGVEKALLVRKVSEEALALWATVEGVVGREQPLDLTGACLQCGLFVNSCLEGAKLRNANLNDTKWLLGVFCSIDFTGASMRKAEILGISCESASFQNADLSEATLELGEWNAQPGAIDFTGANLEGATLKGSLGGAVFTDAIMKGCHVPRDVLPRLSERQRSEVIADAPCFIATAACGSPVAIDVIWLRTFREVILRPSRLGRAFIKVYEVASPPLAHTILCSECIRYIVRHCLVHPAARFVEWLLKRRCFMGPTELRMQPCQRGMSARERGSLPHTQARSRRWP